MMNTKLYVEFKETLKVFLCFSWMWKISTNFSILNSKVISMPHNLLDAFIGSALLYSDHYIFQPFDTALSHYIMFKPGDYSARN